MTTRRIGFAMLSLDVSDEPDVWRVAFQDAKGKWMGDSEMRFTTPGQALDWAIKWAHDRGLELLVDCTDFVVTKAPK